VGRTLSVAEVATNAIGAGATSLSAASVPVAAARSGYWTFTAGGAVQNSEYQLSWGSPVAAGRDDFVGMAATPGRRGYWLVTRYAVVDGFGNAASFPRIRVAHPVTGIVRAPDVGYWLYTADGNVYPSRGTGYYGSPANRHLSDVTGMASLPNGPGYWLVTRTGTVYAFGRAPVRPRIHPARPVIGIVAAPGHGYWLYTADGNVYPSRGTPYYGSPHGSGIVSMLATPDGHGYWLITRTGTVSAFGDAAVYPDAPAGVGAVLGLAG
jgi:hypothetical protein